MSSQSTRAVFEHHAATLAAGDIDGMLDDYTDESVFISNLGGVVTGLDAIRAVFGAGAELPGFELTTTHIEGDTAFITWKAEGMPFGTDTFVVRDGKIAVQTVALHLG